MKIDLTTPDVTQEDIAEFRGLLGRSRKPIDVWFEGNPKAFGFIQEYQRMKAAGETDWGYGKVHPVLVTTFGFPFSKSGLMLWLEAAKNAAKES